nr:nuclear transcription factor Y subunit gamma-like [Aedes albopictus]
MTDQSAGSHSGEKMTDAQRVLEDFWPEVMDDMQRIKHVEPGNQVLPLARIKKIMKLDEDVKMISAEAPLLFAKAAEIFIQELTLRAWLHTEDNKRRTLQRSDIAMAIAKYDQFDFLIDIVPRDEIKPVRRDYETKPATDDVQYYLQLAQQHQQALQSSSGTTPATATTTSAAGPSTSAANIVQVQTAPAVVTQQIAQPVVQQTQPVQAPAPQIATITTPTPNIILTNPVAATTTMQTPTVSSIAPTQIATTGQPFQLVQQVLTPSGEVTHIPIPLTQSQLNFIRSQMQIQGATNVATTSTAATPQPIIIQTPQIQTAPTIIPAGVFLNAAHLHQMQQQQQPQQQQQLHHPQQTQIIQQSPQVVQQQQHHHQVHMQQQHQQIHHQQQSHQQHQPPPHE